MYQPHHISTWMHNYRFMCFQHPAFLHPRAAPRSAWLPSNTRTRCSLSTSWKGGSANGHQQKRRGQQRHNAARLSFVSKRAIKRSQMTKICHHIKSTPSGTQITDRFNQEKQKATTGTLMSEIRPCMAKALPSQTSL